MNSIQYIIDKSTSIEKLFQLIILLIIYIGDID